MSRVYVDLDGVLADFDTAAEAIFGMPPAEFEQLHGARVFWKRLAGHEGFYRDLGWIPGARAMWDWLVEHSPSPPIVLTGLPLGDWAEPQKREWCARELGVFVPVICCRSIDKHTFCSPGDVLIDDRERARLDWETAGGEIVHFRDVESSVADLQQRFSWAGEWRPPAEATPPSPASEEDDGKGAS